MYSFSILTVTKRTGWEEAAEKCVAAQTVPADKWVVIREGDNAPQKIRASNLNASLNAGLRLIESDFVIFYQDFIELEPDCFEKLLALADDKTWVTTCTPNYDGSDDSRYTGIDAPRGCRPEEWEANVAIAPMKMIRELGGFWEELDNGWSWDNVDLAVRAQMLGARFILDESNRPKLYPHEMTSHQTLPLNKDRYTQHIQAIRDGEMPLNVNCL